MKSKSISEKLDSFIRKNKLQQLKDPDSELPSLDLKFCRNDSKRSALKIMPSEIPTRPPCPDGARSHSSKNPSQRQFSDQRTTAPGMHLRHNSRETLSSKGIFLKDLVSNCDKLQQANSQLKKRCSGDLKIVKDQLRLCKRSFGGGYM